MLYSYELFFFTLLSLQVYIFSLRLVEVRIPNYVIKGSSAQLECLYDLDGEALYSVKWYKDGNEFYRYVPRDMPPAQTFLLPGVSVDVHNSSDAIVTLREVTLQSAGRFRCEVSGEAPSFQTVTEHGDMIVVSLPDQGPPKITGGRPRYQIGDWVRINCTAGRSKPAVQLSWFINGEAAAPHSLKKYDVIISGREGLETSVLGLQFRVEQHHFRNGDMKLKCVASLSTLYWRSNEESVEGDRPQKAPVLESRETVYASNSRADPVQASSKTDSMLLNKNSTNLQIILIALVILAILNGNIKHIYLATIILRKGSIQKSNISHSKSNNNNNNNINNNNKDRNEFDMSCSRRKVIKEIALIKIQVKQQHLTLEQSLAMTRYGKQFQEFQQQEEQHKQSLYEICGKNEVKLNEFNLVEEMLENRQLFKNFHSLMMPLFLFPFLILLTYNIKQKQWQWQQYKHHLHHQKHQQKQQQQMPTTVHTISVSVVKKFTNIATTYCISTNNNTNSNISNNNRSSSNKSNNNDTNSHSIICNSTNSSSCNSFSSSNKYHNNAQQLQQQQEKEQQLRHQQQKRQPYQINYR